MNSTTVYNLETGQEVTYQDLSPEEALVATFRQQHGDFNTWDYSVAEVAPYLTYGRYTISLGDWCVSVVQPIPDLTSSQV